MTNEATINREYRITRPGPYGKDTAGHTDPTARQGFYYIAATWGEAWAAASEKFAGEALEVQLTGAEADALGDVIRVTADGDIDVVHIQGAGDGRSHEAPAALAEPDDPISTDGLVAAFESIRDRANEAVGDLCEGSGHHATAASRLRIIIQDAVAIGNVTHWKTRDLFPTTPPDDAIVQTAYDTGFADGDRNLRQKLGDATNALVKSRRQVEGLAADVIKLRELPPIVEALANACLVMILSAPHREWMEKHDPAALRQACKSVKRAVVADAMGLDEILESKKVTNNEEG